MQSCRGMKGRRRCRCRGRTSPGTAGRGACTSLGERGGRRRSGTSTSCEPPVGPPAAATEKPGEVRSSHHGLCSVLGLIRGGSCMSPHVHHSMSSHIHHGQAARRLSCHPDLISSCPQAWDQLRRAAAAAVEAVPRTSPPPSRPRTWREAYNRFSWITAPTWPDLCQRRRGAARTRAPLTEHWAAPRPPR